MQGSPSSRESCGELDTVCKSADLQRATVSWWSDGPGCHLHKHTCSRKASPEAWTVPAPKTHPAHRLSRFPSCRLPLIPGRVFCFLPSFSQLSFCKSNFLPLSRRSYYSTPYINRQTANSFSSNLLFTTEHMFAIIETAGWEISPRETF